MPFIRSITIAILIRLFSLKQCKNLDPTVRKISILGINLGEKPRPEAIKLFSCSTQLSTKFQLLIKTKIPKIVGILTFMSKINFVLS